MYSLATFAVPPTGFQLLPFQTNCADGDEALICVVYIVNIAEPVFDIVMTLPVVVPVASAVGFGSESA
jgi:hypothetical protein